MIGKRLNATMWFALRMYALGLAAFIAAFGAFRWRVPGYRQRYEDVGEETEDSAPDDASARDPSWRPTYRPDVPVASSSPVREYGLAVLLVAFIIAVFLLIALLA